MEKFLSQDSILDILWPQIKRFAAREDTLIFGDVRRVLDGNGNALDPDSELAVSNAIEKMTDSIRKALQDPGALNDEFEESVEFMQEAVQSLAKALMINNPGEGFKSDFLGYIDDWFAGDEKEGRALRFTGAMDYLKFVNQPKPLDCLRGMSASEILDELGSSNGGFGGSWDPVWRYCIDNTAPLYSGIEDGLTEKQLRSFAGIVGNLQYLTDLNRSISAVRDQVIKLRPQLRLAQYHEDEEFIKEGLKLVRALTPDDRYHGTTSSALESISRQGLYMVDSDPDRTSFPVEKFTAHGDPEGLLDSLLMYRSGIDSLRGEGVVLFRGDAKVEKIPAREMRDAKVDYSMTGGLGVEYKIPPEAIIGTIDNEHHKVTFGPAYRREPDDSDTSSK